MKKKWMPILIALIIGSILSVACEKKEEVNPTTIITNKEKADDASARNELDRAQNDIETVYNSDQYAGNQRTSAVNLPCGNVSISSANTNNFEIKYNGVNCGSRVLGGSISVELVSGAKFSEAGAKLKVTFNDYKVHYNSSGEEITYTGITYVTNESGGKLADIFTSTAAKSVVHKVRGQLTLKYDTTGAGGAATADRVWNLFRKKTFATTGASNGTGITYTFEGDTTVSPGTYLPGTGGYDGVSEYGTDVDNRKFIHTVYTPFQWSNCGTTYSGPYILKTGKVIHTAFSDNGDYKYQFSATAGYKLDGGTNALDQSCSSNGYKIEWSATQVSNDNVLLNYSTYQQY